MPRDVGREVAHHSATCSGRFHSASQTAVAAEHRSIPEMLPMIPETLARRRVAAWLHHREPNLRSPRYPPPQSHHSVKQPPTDHPTWHRPAPSRWAISVVASRPPPMHMQPVQPVTPHANIAVHPRSCNETTTSTAGWLHGRLPMCGRVDPFLPFDNRQPTRFGGALRLARPQRDHRWWIPFRARGARPNRSANSAAN